MQEAASAMLRRCYAVASAGTSALGVPFDSAFFAAGSGLLLVRRVGLGPLRLLLVVGLLRLDDDAALDHGGADRLAALAGGTASQREEGLGLAVEVLALAVLQLLDVTVEDGVPLVARFAAAEGAELELLESLHGPGSLHPGRCPGT